MFERYTESARRVIFYARYEASRYGSRYIETEHLLLGLLRDNHALAQWFPGQSGVEPEIRAEIEKRIAAGERISTSMEMPLSNECKEILNLTTETADRMGHKWVEPEHIMIGLLRVEGSLATQVLAARGVKAGPIEEQLGTRPAPKIQTLAVKAPFIVLQSFLAGLKSLDSKELTSLFAPGAAFIDASGKRWIRDEICKYFETLFAHYAKKNASCVVEETPIQTRELFVANTLWKNALLASEQRSWMHRMSIVLVREGGDWEIAFVQVTPVQASSATTK